MTDKAIAVCYASDYDAEAQSVQQAIQYARNAPPDSAEKWMRTNEAQAALRNYLSHFVPDPVALDAVFLWANRKTMNDYLDKQ
jgi:uncharacterized iron-regulated membrane protein